jgi:LPXTG-site transpeptidase (sortase) family protein
MSKKFCFILIICLAALILCSLQIINDSNQEYKYNGYTLLIPKINLSVELNNQSLNSGPLMDNKSSVPGSGPVYIFGHRLSMNSVFLRIDAVGEGDTGSITSPINGRVNYKVDSITLVRPDYIIPIKNETTLYLISCYAGTSRRIIVECKLV